MDPQLYGELIIDKAGKNIQWKKDSIFNKWCWENWTATCKRVKLDYFLTHYTKINSKYNEDLNVRVGTIKILVESIDSNFPDMGHSNSFLDMSPEVRETKAKTNYWDYTKIKSFCIAKEKINKTKQ